MINDKIQSSIPLIPISSQMYDRDIYQELFENVFDQVANVFEYQVSYLVFDALKEEYLSKRQVNEIR